MTPEEKQLISELGFNSLSESEQLQQLDVFYDTLKMRVSMIVEDRLSDEQLDMFYKVSETGNDNLILAYIRKAVPDYQAIVDHETDELKTEVKQITKRYQAIIDKSKKNKQ